MYKKLFFAGVIFSFLVLPMAALADSISPETVTSTITVGGSVTIHKTVTVSAGTPTAAQGDVFFLSDTTGSMGPTISAVQTNASAILAGLAGYGNILTGAGKYQDFPTSPWGGAGDVPYLLNSAIDGAGSTQAGLTAWTPLGYGADAPESQLYALQQVATQAATGWRTGSEKIVLWFGDYWGHDPSLAPADNNTDYPGPTLATTIADLQAAGIQVLAFNVGAMQLDFLGQATAITDDTGGTLYSGFGSNIVDTIVAAIGTAFATYSSVDIAAPSITGLGISVVPTSYMGSFDRSTEQTFGFDVTFTGLTPGTYGFDLFARVDGGNVATERDVITVRVPEPGTLLLLGMGLAGLAGFRKRLFTK